MSTQRPSCCRHRRVFACCAMIMLSSGLLFAAGTSKADASKPARYRVFSLKTIPAEQGKAYLAQIGVTTVSQLPNTNSLLVTAHPAGLKKATAILKLTDSTDIFVIKPLAAISELDDFPSNEQIAIAAGVSIGTFSDPPVKDANNKVIIDIDNKKLIAVATARSFEKITSAIEQLRQKKTEAIQAAEPDEANDELFSKLLSDLEKAEEKEEEAPKPQIDTSISPSVDSKQAEETTLPEIKETPQPDEKIVEKTTKPQPTRRSYQPEPSDIGDEMLELNLPEKLNIVELLGLVGEYLNLDYMYDPVKVKGEVALRLRGPIKVKGLYPLLESVLKFRGFVMTRKGDLVTIVPAGEVLDIDPTLIYDDKGEIQMGDVIVTRVFNLRYIDSESARNLLSKMKLGANVEGIPDTGTLIVTGFAYRMGRIEELLKMMDVPGEPKQFRFRQLRYTLAETLAEQVKKLMEQMGGVSITIAKAAPTPQPKRTRGKSRSTPKKSAQPAKQEKTTLYLAADQRTNRILMIGMEQELKIAEGLIVSLDVAQQDLRSLRLYEIQHVGAEEVQDKLAQLGIIGSAQQKKQTTRPGRIKQPKGKGPESSYTDTGREPLTEEPQVVIIESTDSLLVNATPEQHARIALIIAYVDTEAEQASIPYVVYPLENQDPARLKEVLDQLVEGTATAVKDKDDKIVKTTQKTENDKPIIVADANTYSLIVYGSKKNQQWISSLIKQLDEYRPQVLLDVTLVEITKSDEFTFDLDLVSKLPNLIPGETMVSGSDLIGAIVSPFPAKTAIELRAKSGTGTGFYADRHIQALLDVMDKKGYGRVLARPKLLVNDNEEGSIKSAEVQYVASERVSTIAGTTATTSVQDRSITFDSYDAGIELTIRPHISKGDQLRLNITLNRTDFRPAGQPVVIGTDTIDKPLDTISSNVTTVVTVPDGTTIILGGMERLNQTKSGTKIPILGDIPLLGGLFRSIDNTDQQSRLYVFVKAHILRPGEETPGASDLEVVSAKNRATFEKYEKQMQQYQDWPGIKAKPMDPLKILEAD